MPKDYDQIICEAVDSIVAARLEGLEFDITRECIIIDDSQKKDGRYVVKDGTAKYEAYSETEYFNGNNVLVNIPNGNYNLTKTIIGRQASFKTEPFKYVSPLDRMIKITGSVLDSSKDENGEYVNNEYGLVANYEPKSSIDIKFNMPLNNYTDYSRLGISADFKSLLEEYNIISGTYGLRFTIMAKDRPTEANQEPSKHEYQFDFTNEDMYGNPYTYNMYLTQEKIFDISNIGVVEKVNCQFFHSNDFKDSNGNLITIDEDKNSIITKTDKNGKEYWEFKPEFYKYYCNLFVKNIKIYFGYDKSDFNKETTILYTNDDINYSYEDDNKKREIQLRWIHKVNDDEYEIVKPPTDTNRIIKNKNMDNYYYFDNDERTIRYYYKWLRYTPDLEKEVRDKELGAGWQPQPLNYPESTLGFSYQLQPDYGRNSEIILVKCYCIALKDENEVTSTRVDADNTKIEFFNSIKVPDKATLKAVSDLTFVYNDNSDGNYFIYDQNGVIINDADSSRERTIELYYKGTPIDEKTGLTQIQWIFPNFKKNPPETMIIHQLDGQNYDKNSSNGSIYGQITYDEFEIKKYWEETEQQKYYTTKQKFKIDKTWSFEKNKNNTVICKATIKGSEYQVFEEMNFGRAGTNGTNYTFVLDFADGKICLDEPTPKDSTSITIVPHLYGLEDTSNSEFLSINNKNIKWKVLKDEDKNKKYKWADIEKSAIYSVDEYGQLTITASITNGKTNLTDENLFIKAEISTGTNSPTLEAYIGVPYRTALGQDIAYIEGTKEVIYNNNGIPKYYSGPYVAYNSKNSKIQNLEWILQNSNEEQIIIKEVAGKKNYYFAPYPFYVKENADQVKVIVVKCQKNKQVLWTQPVLISQDQYQFTVLNQWDGKLKIDNDNNYILSAMLGAGKKDSQNRFSGVLMGDIRSGADNKDTSALTGVYGYHEGVQSFSLTEDGKATFGKAGRGQIQIDGNESVIKSGRWDEIDPNTKKARETGMYLDLDDGKLDIRGENGSEILIQGDKEKGWDGTYLQILSQETPVSELPQEMSDFSKKPYRTPLMLIKEGKNGTPENYILQSKNYFAGNYGEKNEYNYYNGSYFDLSNGILIFGNQRDSKYIKDDTDIYGHIKLSKNENFLQVVARKGKTNEKTILSSGKNNLIQSIDYSGGEKDEEKDAIKETVVKPKRDGYFEKVKIFYYMGNYSQSHNQYFSFKYTLYKYKYDTETRKQNIVNGWQYNIDISPGIYVVKVNEDFYRVDLEDGELKAMNKLEFYNDPKLLGENEIISTDPKLGGERPQQLYNKFSAGLRLLNQYDEPNPYLNVGGKLQEIDLNTREHITRDDLNLNESKKIFYAIKQFDGAQLCVQYLWPPGDNKVVAFKTDKGICAINKGDYFATRNFSGRAFVFKWNGDYKQILNPGSYTKYEVSANEDITNVLATLNAWGLKLYKIASVVNSKSGLKIDLDTGLIDGYNLYLRGQSASGNGSFTLDSSASIDQKPFAIKDASGVETFGVKWDGTLNCNRVDTLNNDGRNDMAISINDNFYVNKSGGAGGGSCDFDSGTFGGLSAGPTSVGTLKVGGEDYSKTNVIINSVTGMRINIVNTSIGVYVQYQPISFNALCTGGITTGKPEEKGGASAMIIPKT